MREKITVLDFGSQYAHLIAKRLRLMGYYSDIALPSSPTAVFENCKGIILSGGPSSVYEKNIPQVNPDVFDLGIPVLGLCYGHQLLSQHCGGTVEKAKTNEFGIAKLNNENCPDSPLFKGINFPLQVWMSHQDAVVRLPEGFERTGFTRDCSFAALQDLKRKYFGLQFHVEVKDTQHGNVILENFARYCGIKQNWNQDTVLKLIIEQIREQAKERNVLLFLSGGVDSTVTFALLNQALGKERVTGLHIDNGFMRKNESALIAERYRAFGFTNFIVEDASHTFLQAIAGETDPQKKRHIVGETFIRVRDEIAERCGFTDDKWLLAQGTLYPDIIESGGSQNAHVIKTHHNRVAGIQKLIEKGLIIEPLKDLYKDEVRILGTKLGLSGELIMRHPFPGPGLSINVLCTAKKTPDQKEYEQALCEAERFEPEVRKICAEFAGLKKIGVLPIKSVGVQGDFRTYRFPAVLYMDDIKAFFASANEAWDSLEKTASLITNNAEYINRTVVALYEKPQCTLHQAYCTKERLDQIREADAIMLEQLHKTGWYGRIFQHLTINLPYAVQQKNCAIVLRPVVSEDVMTARFARLDPAVLFNTADKITKLSFTDALYYDISSKPPATFGWE